eukprot:TRINITY_DN1412_c0_g1_i3.p2 TRINITY_DN1412_c0_g1~~TRINITY_DN1412_c0_g1_i3.p2  ORF type:complete len:375 (+),score=90.95 TRINITY_DN1412_c0_g1_i3:1736-2860(+)
MHFLLAAAIATVISPTDERIQYIGRSVTLGTGERVFDNPGFRIVFKVQGTSDVAVQMKALHAGPSYALDTGYAERAFDNSAFVLNFFEVLIDGKRQAARLSTGVTANNTVYSFPLASGLSSGVHTIEVFKSTEADWNARTPTPNYITFTGIVVSDGGSLVAPDPLPTRRIEFVGDSITAGYCNLCHDTPAPQDEAAESFYDSWASQICRGANATCHNIAWSGFGVVRNYAPGNVTLPDVYRQTLASDVGSPAWDFASWKPDAVVVNLGTNDHVKCVGDFCDQFIATYTAMVQNAAASYGKGTQWFLACGPMSTAYCPQVHTVITTLGGLGITAHFLDQTALGGNNTCCGHPSVLGDNDIAEHGLAFIKQTMKWN